MQIEDLSGLARAGAAPAQQPGVTRGGYPRLRFRSFVVEPSARLLLRGGEAVELGSRAFDLLMILLAQRGRVVSKSEIFTYVWPDTQVEESNLRFQMTTLRNVLGGDRDLIKTIPGRGYLFAEECRADGVPAPAPAGSFREPTHLCGAETETKQVAAVAARRVAIIEDHPETREALGDLLRSAGLTVEAFGSVHAYSSQARREPPGCLVLDVVLPGQTGLEFQAELRRSGVRIPIVFISGHGDVHMGVEAMKAGASDFLVKPVRHRDLLDAVRLALSPLGHEID